MLQQPLRMIVPSTTTTNADPRRLFEPAAPSPPQRRATAPATLGRTKCSAGSQVGPGTADASALHLAARGGAGFAFAWKHAAFAVVERVG